MVVMFSVRKKTSFIVQVSDVRASLTQTGKVLDKMRIKSLTEP